MATSSSSSLSLGFEVNNSQLHLLFAFAHESEMLQRLIKRQTFFKGFIVYITQVTKPHQPSTYTENESRFDFHLVHQNTNISLEVWLIVQVLLFDNVC